MSRESDTEKFNEKQTLLMDERFRNALRIAIAMGSEREPPKPKQDPDHVIPVFNPPHPGI